MTSCVQSLEHSHHKRTISGVVPYFSERAFADVEEMAFLQPEALAAPDFDAAAASLGEAVNGWRIGYVVVHPEFLSSDAQANVERLAVESGALCPAVSREGLVIYRATWHPEGCDLQ